MTDLAANDDTADSVTNVSGDGAIDSPNRRSADASNTSSRFVVGHRGWAFAGLVFLCFGLGLTIVRTAKQYQTPGPFHPVRQGMCDFHNAIYFPARAVLAGESPYGEDYAAKYPVSRQIPFFSPSILVLHSPMTMLPIRLSEIAYFALSIAMIFVIAILVCSHARGRDDRKFSGQVRSNPIRLDHVIWISTAIVFSRGGHISLYLGYFTLELVLATLVAIHFADRRPWVSAIALAVVSAKPTYILPLGFLMLARGNVKAIVIGAVISIVTAAAPMAWMAYHEGNGDLGTGMQVIMDDISGAQELHRNQFDETPVNSWTRIDLLAIVAKWTGDDPGDLTHLGVMGLILAPVMWVLYRMRKLGQDDGLTGITGGLITTAMLVSLYHQSYDALLLMAPLAGIWLGGSWLTDQNREQNPGDQNGKERIRSGWRRMNGIAKGSIMILMMVPLFNYLSTKAFLSRTILSDAAFGGTALESAGEPLVYSTTLSRLFTSINGVALAFALAILLAASFGLGMRRHGRAESSTRTA